MSQEDAVNFYDLPTKPPKTSWSLNPWKVRLYLNYKNIPYKTIWLEYPEVAPFLKDAGVKPHAKGTAVADYTLPAVKLPNGTYMMESIEIAQELERLYPQEPKLIIDIEKANEVRELIMPFVKKSPGIYHVNTSRKLLAQESKIYFDPTRAAWYEVGSLDELAEKAGLEASWELIRGGVEKLGVVLRENGTGPFVLGKEVSFADFVILGWLKWTRTIEEEYYQKVVGFEPALKALYEASQQWFERDDH